MPKAKFMTIMSTLIPIIPTSIVSSTLLYFVVIVVFVVVVFPFMRILRVNEGNNPHNAVQGNAPANAVAR